MHSSHQCHPSLDGSHEWIMGDLYKQDKWLASHTHHVDDLTAVSGTLKHIQQNTTSLKDTSRNDDLITGFLINNQRCAIDICRLTGLLNPVWSLAAAENL